MTKKIVWLVTDNKDKLKDFKLVFKPLGIELKQLTGIKIKEGTKSLRENAYLKALAASRLYSQRVIMATDGGVEIPYLGDKWNPVLTKRLGGLDMEEKLTDRQRTEKLIEIMKGAKGKDRWMQWWEVVIIMKGSKILYETKIKGGKGYLMDKIPPGFKESGFWLAYVWLMPKLNKPYMFLSDEERLKYGTVKSRLLKELKKVDVKSWFL